MAATPGATSSQVPQIETAILWFRRDLRVTDNRALVALQGAKQIIPVFIWAPEEEGQFQPGRCSRWWLHESLGALEQDLQALGSSLVYRRAKDSRSALIDMVQATGAQALFFNHLYDPISLVRDNEVKFAMQELGVQCRSFSADMLYEPMEILSSSGQLFTSFKAFWDRVTTMEFPPHVPLPVPERLPPLPEVPNLGRKGLGLMTAEEQESNQQLYHAWTPGGKGAYTALEDFVRQRLPLFSNDRAKTDRASTSRMSAHIHYGELSVAFIYYVIQQRKMQDSSDGCANSCKHFLRYLGFREYGRYLSFHFPFTHERSLLEHLRAAPFKFDQQHFKAWRQGSTGYPMVDASMQQLWSTGWLHNRSRVICASFLVKNLLLPWQWGLKHFWDCLLDADLECDALGWQYCSGCLADAHPFEYMFNQVVAATKHDPDGNYVRRWLPVLARLPTKWIHKPWEAPGQVLLDAGVELGVNYPAPIISLAESETQLRAAAKVVQQALAASASAVEVPFRPASLPPNGRITASQPWNPETYVSSAGVRLQDMTEASGISGKPGDEAAVASGAKRRRMEPPRLTKEEEEVVSNMVRVAPADSSAGGGTLQAEVAQPPVALVAELPNAAAVDGNAELQATANGAVNGSIGTAQQLEGDEEDDDDAAAVVPSMSVASKKEPGSVFALTEQQASLSIQEPGEEAISPL